MTVQPLERRVTEPQDRYLAAYASVHSILEETETPAIQAVRGKAEAASQPPRTPAGLTHSAGGRHKVKRRRFRPVPETALATD